jgi:ABC-2 type transport system ATP-binding protein
MATRVLAQPSSITLPSPNGRAGPPAIEAEHLTKRYGDLLAVDDVSLRVWPGEVFGFLGPNGSGKTTTIGMLLGAVTPTSGTVRLFGETLRGRERDLLSRVGALVEVPTFYPYLGARDNLRLLARLHGDLGDQRIEHVLALCQLTQAAGRPFSTYSLGMKQRLGIAAALLGDPDVIVLDEPTNGLDPAGMVEIRALLRSLAAQGKAIFLSSHQLNEVQLICDRVAIVHAGRIVASGAVSDLLRQERVIHLTVSDPERAEALLSTLPWVERVVLEAGRITVAGTPPEPFALSQTLAQHGIWIGQLVRPEPSLEQYFLRLIGHGAQRNGQLG